MSAEEIERIRSQLRSEGFSNQAFDQYLARLGPGGKEEDEERVEFRAVKVNPNSPPREASRDMSTCCECCFCIKEMGIITCEVLSFYFAIQGVVVKDQLVKNDPALSASSASARRQISVLNGFVVALVVIIGITGLFYLFYGLILKLDFNSCCNPCPKKMRERLERKARKASQKKWVKRIFEGVSLLMSAIALAIAFGLVSEVTKGGYSEDTKEACKSSAISLVKTLAIEGTMYACKWLSDCAWIKKLCLIAKVADQGVEIVGSAR